MSKDHQHNILRKNTSIFLRPLPKTTWAFQLVETNELVDFFLGASLLKKKNSRQGRLIEGYTVES